MRNSTPQAGCVNAGGEMGAASPQSAVGKTGAVPLRGENTSESGLSSTRTFPSTPVIRFLQK